MMTNFVVTFKGEIFMARDMLVGPMLEFATGVFGKMVSNMDLELRLWSEGIPKRYFAKEIKPSMMGAGRGGRNMADLL
jgi:hypothetical protein